MKWILDVDQLKVSVDGTNLLNGVNLKIAPKQIHAIMGPNGSGKTTLVQVLAGNENYTITGGKITYQGVDLAALSTQVRAQKGLFVGFQNPIDLPGVRIMSFLQAMVNAHRKGRGLDALNPADFLKQVREKAALLNIEETLLRREVNVGFSGGERKRFEVLQMLLLEPSLLLLDEIDSGLDIDALQWVARATHYLHERGAAVLLITHYRRLLDLIPPEHVHIMSGGAIIRSGDRSLATEIERSGYQPSAEKALS